jgi:hypothetical protein
MLDTVLLHVDEKWFIVNQPTVKCYMAPDEEDSQRASKSKKCITKVMLILAVGRPPWVARSNKYFHGKLGI